jgi:quercetin dioxygenase-like cupin family protein
MTAREQRFERLKELSEHLIDFPGLVLGDSTKNIVRYKMEQGSIVGEGLYHGHECAVMRCFSEAGTIMARHSHQEIEHILCISGRMDVYLDDDDCRTLLPGDAMRFAPGTPHFLDYPVDTWSLGITIPASPAYAAEPEGAEDAK